MARWTALTLTPEEWAAAVVIAGFYLDRHPNPSMKTIELAHRIVTEALPAMTDTPPD